MLPKNQVPEIMEARNCQIETKFKCQLPLDIENINKDYSHKGDIPHLATRKDFGASFNNGNRFKGYLCLTDQRLNCKSLYVIMAEKNFIVQELIVNYDFAINGIRIKGSAKADEVKFSNVEYMSYGAKINLKEIKEKFSTCKGWIEIEFKPYSGIQRKQELQILQYRDTFESNPKDMDFTIVCYDKFIKFNKRKLCNVSDVFQKMIETGKTF